MCGRSNLALAEKTGLDLVTSCSSCYVTLYQANLHLKEHPELILLLDVTPEVIASKVQRGLNELKVAFMAPGGLP
ncbi:hypothetical protein M1N05_02600 [Dehalococcoidales bacterium]|nr:hypothetical protein [Dehalococcoidales bacterium]